MMTPGDWNRIKQIFSDALSVPSAEREAYVRSACGQQQDIERAVENLLRAHYEASQTFLEHRSLAFGVSWLFREGERVANRFTVLKPIARGAMGEVYQVRDERLRLDIALKAIRPELVGDPDTSERFRREVLVTRDLAHDGLCRIFDLIEHHAGVDSGLPEGTVIPCLTMQLLDGETLEDRLAARRPMAVAEALPLVQQISDALQVLHAAGIVHRDLKPSNVMLVPTADGTRAVLMDFGLAKPLDQSVFETQVRVQGGAPFFMAPELFRGGRPSRATDIYAFGLLIDEMVTSSRAFSGDSLHTLLLQKLGDGPEPPSRRAATIPRAWERAILRCLSPDPRSRFASTRDVLVALAAPERSWHRWVPFRMRSNYPRRWRLAGYSAVIAMALAGVAAVEGPVQGTTPKSVVIGTFSNLTNKPELDYLASGTAGELARRLSRVGDLRVYQQTDSTAPINASDHATYSLQGNVQEVNAVTRITVRVTDAKRGSLLWSQNFDGPRDRSLELEEQLANETVIALARLSPVADTGAIRGALASLFSRWPARSPQIPATGTSNSAAFDAYLRGRVLFEERTLPTALQAIDYLKKAVRYDPGFAAPYATLADVQGVLMDLHYAPHDTLIARAEEYATRAVTLDPDSPDAQLSLAALRQAQWRWADAETAYRRAIELHPTFARAYRWYGGLVLQFGRFDESLALYRRGLELDPFDYPSQSAYGHALFHAGRAREAATQLEHLLDQKDLFYGHALLGQVYAYLGSVDGARREEYLQKALQRAEILRSKESAVQENSAVTEYADLVAALAWSYQHDLASAAPYVNRLEAGHAQGRVSPSVLARVYAAQENSPRALAALLEAEAQRDRELLYINVSPHYASIRHEPQFRALVQRLHLED